jgi:hypothetical protein
MLPAGPLIKEKNIMRKKRSVPEPRPPKETEPLLAVGPCPLCGREVIMTGSDYACAGTFTERRSNGVLLFDCEFSVYRYAMESMGKPDISPEEMRDLLGGGTIYLHRLRRKDGRRFSCYGVLGFKDNPWGVRFTSSIMALGPTFRNLLRRSPEETTPKAG